ncbi:hypothetical protein OR1_00090 [Geobacter sp. OR-1]|uniref:hypothetical protein n=1 Tax=Geobacter sp. OR-1 TaxID=1266765 RepID=UPI00054228F8|nr:hypothetical protein [Geobacter sp. OR-1]GAM07821.1 hypothetical protein OR1_00090 [Geobacter sp. OR-1]
MPILKKIFIVLNGFVHDFSAGFWLASVTCIKILHSFQLSLPSVAQLLGTIERVFFWNSLAAAAVIMITGAGRVFTYVDNAFGDQTERARRIMLIIKHVILLLIFGSGGWYGYLLAFHT